MKTLSIIIILIATILTACHKDTVGFLDTHAAKYDTDSLVVKHTLDPNNYSDAKRIKYGSHWVSEPLQGFDGTKPIFITIKEVVATEGGDINQFLNDVDLRGDGTFDIPLDHKIPIGRYVVSLNIKNEGYTKYLNSIFTVIVK